jgi:hypothetical protein
MKTRNVKVDGLQRTRTSTLLLKRSVCLAKQPRQDWGRAFHRMAERGDDELLVKNLFARTYWDEDEWQW